MDLFASVHERSKLNYDSMIDGVNTTVASVQAKLDQARWLPSTS
jgi:hypothetical protein